MTLSANTIRKIKPVDPFVERGVIRGRSYGLSVAGYDCRINLDAFVGGVVTLEPGDFKLFHTLERFNMPLDVVGRVCDKSSWLRRGIRIGNTVIEPGWEGWLTIELFNCGAESLVLMHGDPICQVLFDRTDEPTEGYRGKYQNQENRPVEARHEV